MKGASPFGSGTPIYLFAEQIFTDNKYSAFYDLNMVLDPRPISSSVSENKVKGTIQFSVGYKPIPSTVQSEKSAIPHCIALVVNVNEENKPFSIGGKTIQQQTVVPVMILGREKGPILQDMKTTKESSKTVQLEATVDIFERKKLNDPLILAGVNLALSYAPSGMNSFLNALTHNWDWTIGKLTVNAGWIYTKK